MIALVDYGAGNLTSVRKAFAAIGANVWTPALPGELGRAHGVVLPGVGHFDATQAITPEWRTAITTLIDDEVPLLGICVGLQWLFEGSEEAPGAEGFGCFPGRCFNLANGGVDTVLPQAESRKPQVASLEPQAASPKPHAASRKPLKVPHVGWNAVTLPRTTRLMAGIDAGTQFYFTHSFAAPVGEHTAAICEYGVPFSAAMARGAVSAVQFHPEKSGDAGLRVLRNWLATVKGA